MNPDAFAYPPGVGEQLDAYLVEGNREAAFELVLREVVKMPDDDIRAFRAMPSWQSRLDAVHTVPREDRAIAALQFDPEQAAKIRVPTLLVTGADTPPHLRNSIETVANALPDARILELEGQQHVADVLVPQVFADHLLAFLRSS